MESEGNYTPDTIFTVGPEPSDELVVFLRGFAASSNEYFGLMQLLQEATKADLYYPDFDSSLLTISDQHEVSDDLADRFNQFVNGYQRVHFVAHSMGAVFLRNAFMKGLGTDDQPTPLRVLHDRRAVRMTLLAATSRGYTPSGVGTSFKLGVLRRWYWLMLLWVAIGWSLKTCALSRGADRGVQGVAAALAAIGTALPRILQIAIFVAGFVVHPSAIPLLFNGFLWLQWASDAEPGYPITAGVVTTLTALAAGWYLARNRRDIWPMTLLAGALSAAAPWIAAHPDYAWPATLAALVPLVLYPMRSRLMLEHLLYGAPWITGVRLRWIETFSKRGGLRPPPIVHLFGEEDRLVGDDDHVELHHDIDALELAIRGVAHGDFQLSSLRYEVARNFRVGSPGIRTRRDAFTPALFEALRRAFGENPQDRLRELGDGASLEARVFAASADAPTVFRIVEPVGVRRRRAAGAATASLAAPAQEHAVFLVHGMRDFAGWEDSLAAKCGEIAVANKVRLIEPVQVRYGYFNAFQFLLSAERERATRSFVDLYTQTKARYPDALCQTAAHSNGTYVIANALRQNEFLRLERLYLAGSVLSRNFGWRAIGPNRDAAVPDGRGVVSGTIRSDRAAQDWPVGVLCWFIAAFGKLPILKTFYGLLGTGGVYGFRERNDAQGVEFVFENAYLPGTHGEALLEKYHGEIASFLLTGGPIKTTHLLARRADERLLWGVRVAVLVGLATAAAAFVAPAFLGPQCAAWGIAVGASTLLILVRGTMAA